MKRDAPFVDRGFFLAAILQMLLPLIAALVPSQARAQTTIEILFTYGSEKKSWVEDVTKEFNAAGVRLPSGERIVVTSRPDGSNVIVSEALDGTRKPHLISPASKVFLIDANGRAGESNPPQPPLVVLDQTQELVRSPLVIAIWREMAEAMGWPGKPIGWRDFFDYLVEPDQWKAIRKTAWGTLKYGHTHPEYSNSGLLTLLAEVYAATKQFDPENVKRGDLRDHDVIEYIRKIEATTPHYGESTGFFAERMFQQGPQFLTAAVLYENLVYEANKKARADGVLKPGAPPQVVAIYPSEGTFPNEHPVGIVNRSWVTPRHREAAQKYIDFLLARPRQEKALNYGLRPADKSIPVESVLKPEYGVDPAKFTTELKPPSYEIVKLALALWRQYKRPADLVLAIDTSGSMNGAKIKNAEAAAMQCIDQLSDGDSLAIILFSDSADFVRRDPFRMDAAGKEKAKDEIQGLIAGGQTAFNQAVQKGYAYLEGKDPAHNRGLIVLSDGRNTEKGLPDEAMFNLIKNDGEKKIYVFTIGYGSGTDLAPDVLERVAKESAAKYFKAEPDSIGKILREIVTFF